MAVVERDQAAPHGAHDAAPSAALLRSSMSEYEIQARPNAFYEALRQLDPVHWDEKLGMYLISRYEDMQKVCADPITFSVERGYHEQYAKGYHDEFREIMEREGGGYCPDAIKSDPPYHTRIRKLMELAFTAHRVKALEPAITTIVAEVLDRVADKGVADGVSEIAGPITASVICEQLGISRFDAHKIAEWSHAVVAQIGRMQSHDQMVANARKICELQLFLIDHIRERESAPRDDMITDLVHARLDDGTRLTFREIVSLVRALLIAGNETTSTAIGNLLMLLATRPDLADEVHHSMRDDRYLNRFVEELLRWQPPSRGLSRMTTREVELGGKLLPEGAHLLLLWASGNNDEHAFENPRTFHIGRQNLGRHLSFGAGAHKCIGMSLARMELKVAAREIVRGLENIRLEIPVSDLRYVPTIAVHPIAELPITFTARA